MKNQTAEVAREICRKATEKWKMTEQEILTKPRPSSRWRQFGSAIAAKEVTTCEAEHKTKMKKAEKHKELKQNKQQQETCLPVQQQRER